MMPFYHPKSRIRLLVFLGLLISNGSAAAQSIDSLWTPSIPPLHVPEYYKGPAAPSLPFQVDNSLLPYFRPIYNQAALECGQAAGVAYTFTYEMDRLRNLPANTTSNQYPTHWVWNFSNNGINSGISFFESWDIIRHLGTPNVAEWGGTPYYGGQNRWISGYNTYYSAMRNRLNGVYGINVSDTNGIKILKHWLHDRLDSSTTGGVAAFYAEYNNNPTPFPSGVYAAGKHVIPYWGGSPNHAMTVVGYDDSIRWDYNADGLYTNHLDINGDGYVDLADWEIGGFKLANSYGGVPAWGDNGFCYFMYNTLARPLGQGGIWNQTVYVIDPVHDYNPLLTLRVKVKHSSRERLKLSIGVSADTALTQPQIEKDFPAFRFQGGNHYMQGGSAEADKTIELGFDLTQLLSHTTAGSPASYFFLVDERDPSNVYPGEIISMSLLDYTGMNPVEIMLPNGNIPIQNNSRTALRLVHAMNFNAPAILDTVLPPVVVSKDYQFTLSAGQGQSPYQWSLVHDYDIAASNINFPTGGQSVSSISDGRTMVVLPFSFPFMGKWHDTVYVHVDGYISFDNELKPWPYVTDEVSFMRGTRCIAPMMYKGFTNYSSVGDGIWRTVMPDGIIFRWNTSMNGAQSTSDAQFAVKLWTDGKISFYYGNVSFPWSLYPVIGFSAGNSVDFVTLPLQGVLPVINGTHYEVVPKICQTNLQISEEGQLWLPKHSLPVECPLRVRVTDRRGISTSRLFQVTQKGVLANLSYSGGGDTVLHAGELGKVHLTVENIGDSALTNVQFLLRVLSSNAVAVDSLEALALLAPDTAMLIPDAFSFSIDSIIQDHEKALLELWVVQGFDTLRFEFAADLRTSKLSIGTITVADGNDNILSPGETAALIVRIINDGGVPVSDLRTRLFTWDPYIQIFSDSAHLQTIPIDSSAQAFFIVYCLPTAPVGHLVVFRLEFEAGNGFIDTLHFFVVIGDQTENFETGGFTSYPWQFSGNMPWTSDTSVVFSGLYSARSGLITHNQTSELFINLTVINDDVISFYRKVDSEPDNTNHNYDYLSFSIDGLEQARWDGNQNWARYEFPVSRGVHAFKWTYRKDYSVNTGLDAAWLDEINLPIFGVVPPLEITAPEAASGLVLHAFPNPSDGQLELMVNSPVAGDLHVMVYDLMGKVIYGRVHSYLTPGSATRLDLDLRQVSSKGMFLVRVVDAGNNVQMQKVLVR